MPANEFEKQVQSKMDEFRPEPSASVWEKVEKEIRNKKRRRVIFFILLPALLALLSYMGYRFLYTNSPGDLVQQNISPKEESSQTTTNKDVSDEKKENNLQQPTANKTDLPITNKENKEITTDKTESTRKNDLQVTTNEPVISRKKKISTEKNKKQNTRTRITQDNSLAITTEPPQKKRVIADDNVADTKKNDVVTDNKIAESKNDEVVAIIPAKDDKKKNEITTDTMKDAVKQDTAETVAMADDQQVAEQKKKASRSKIRWGIDLSAGITSTSEGFLLLPASKSLDAYSNVSPGSSAGSQSPATGPSVIKLGLSFKTGVAAELLVSEMSRFSAGLQYMYASNRLKTGTRRDSTVLLSNSFASVQVDAIYRGAPQNNYTNRYHFIRLPIQYHLQIGKGNKLPVQWNIGAAFSYLIATNGLVYDTASRGIYYHNKDAFNKAHVELNTGLSLRIRGKNGLEWILGPEISFDMRRLINNPFDKKQYLSHSGIGARLLFPQNKK